MVGERLEKMYIELDGMKFYKCANGYYSNGKGERLHRYVWEKHNGAIEKGYHVHHIDKNKDNNDIRNLMLMHGSEHMSKHSNEMDKDKARENLDKYARPKAIEWHGSAEGRAWHRKHWEETGSALYKERTFQCANCGKEFKAMYGGKKNTFCGNNCKSAYRRKIKADFIEKPCEVCGKPFSSNKYNHQHTCSRECASKLTWEKRHAKSKIG